MRSLPLISVVMESIQANHEFVAFPDLHVSDYGVMREFKVTCIGSCRLHPQGFHNHPVQVLHFIGSLKCHHFSQEFNLAFLRIVGMF